MAFLESDRVQIRHFMGAGEIFLQSWPLLESAITAVQSSADGGVKPDSSAETAIRQNVTDLQSIEALMLASLPNMMALTADEVKVDFARALMVYRVEGRRLAFSLARRLGFDAVLGDVFSSRPPGIPNRQAGPDTFSR